MDLTTAIDERRALMFTYDGLPRTVQPATYGYTGTGKLTLRACLIDGQSRRNTIPCWELYTVEKMEGLEETGETFTTFDCDGYTRGDSAFERILAEH